MKKHKIKAGVIALALGLIITGCSSIADTSTTETSSSSVVSTSSTSSSSSTLTNLSATGEAVSLEEGAIIDTTDLFTSRDLEQTADLSEAINLTLTSGNDVNIYEEGVYILTGDVTNVTITVDADDEAKVELVLDGVTITNDDAPAIYVKGGDKVFITTTDSESTLEVTGAFVADGDTNLDAVIFSKSDLVLKGQGILNIISEQGHAVVSKDDLKVTGGTYLIDALNSGFRANDSISIYSGSFDVTVGSDAFHSENEEDTSLGTIYIQGGSFVISAGDDAIRATSYLQIDGGRIEILTSAEGIEGTYIQINGGDITLYATDDGINATKKSNATVLIEVNGGNIDVTVGSGDTDGFDSNGNIVINGGTIYVTANSAFDSDGSSALNGGSVYVNGTQITTITESQMGHGGGGGKR